jgi:AbrB family looped-hinge helix DNA binding protein
MSTAAGCGAGQGEALAQALMHQPGPSFRMAFAHSYGIVMSVWGNIFHMGHDGGYAVKARVMPDGRVSLPAELRKKHGLAQGGEVIVEDAGDAIVLRTVDQVVARAQALSRKLVAGKTGASVDDFLADRAREAEAE